MCRNSDDDDEHKEVEEEAVLTVSESPSSKNKKKNPSMKQTVKILKDLISQKIKRKREKLRHMILT